MGPLQPRAPGFGHCEKGSYVGEYCYKETIYFSIIIKFFLPRVLSSWSPVASNCKANLANSQRISKRKTKRRKVV